MKILRTLLLVTASFCFNLPGYSAAGASVADFALLDHQGKFHRLSYYGDQRAIVILVQANGDAVARQSATDLELLRADYEARDIVFFMLNPSAADDRHTIAAEASSQGYTLPILVDESQLVAETLGVSRAGEALIINPATMQLVYQGRAGAAATELRAALETILGGGNPIAGQPADQGAAIEYASSAGARTRHHFLPPRYRSNPDRELCLLPPRRRYWPLVDVQSHHGEGLVEDDARSRHDTPYASGPD